MGVVRLLFLVAADAQLGVAYYSVTGGLCAASAMIQSASDCSSDAVQLNLGYPTGAKLLINGATQSARPPGCFVELVDAYVGCPWQTHSGVQDTLECWDG
eukprot:Hpha_TRINITY_DN8724_c0_g2::TRINITY_DN8724_c0_g2_i1::g.45456::m.45456